ncbi:MAG: CRISPR-associated helicase Cas3' [Pyrinomonadaceae bacterium]|nr:CRISPR-associated helicase Cas3' [Pyrinomonadaceae bacterium]
MNQSHDILWAKSVDEDIDNDGKGESLFRHSVNVAENAKKICDRLPFPTDERKRLAKILVEVGALHDIGKAASGFQKMLRTDLATIRAGGGWGHRHETLSTALACILNPNLEETALFAILTHHKDIPFENGANEKSVLPTGELPPNFYYTNETAQWEEMLTHLRENWMVFQDFLEDLAEKFSFDWTKVEITDELLYLGISDDWLDRSLGRNGQIKRISKENRWQASLLRGLLITSDHLASANDRKEKDHPEILDIPNLIDLEAKIKQKELGEHSILPYQIRASETIGNTILKAPTGAGKTLAALLWVCRNQSENGRFFYVLPFTASINAMARRFSEIFDEKNVGVLHHKNADYLFRLMEKDEMSLKVKNRQAKHLKSLAKEMYHPIRISTPHQILRFALRGRGWETGLAEFVNSCIVYDEVHAFEPLITGLTLATAKLLKSEPFNTKILFTSATIPKFLEKIIRENLEIDELHIIEPNPNDEQDRKITDKKRHKINVCEGNLFENLPTIVSEIRNFGQSTLIFCNHVKTSQQVYDEVRKYGFSNVTLLHSRFNGRDRTEIEKKITRKLNKNEKAELRNKIKENSLATPILVATQAVEVSLDIDYERGYSEPAPADALGQRLGRVNRSGSQKDENNNLICADIFIFSQPTNGYLYDEETTNKTVELLRNIEGELSEQELTEIVDKVYENGYSLAAQQEFENALKNKVIANFVNEIIAGTHNDWKSPIFDENDFQVEVLPQSLLTEFTDLMNQNQSIQARTLLVPIRRGQYFKAEKMGAIQKNEKLREYIVTLAYSKDKGLASDKLDDSNFI